MNKYSELSDFEINKLVAEELGYKYECDDAYGYVLVHSISSCYDKFSTVIVRKNYCSDYSDAFQLMFDNEIALNPVIESDNWRATGDFHFEKHGSERNASAVHEHPCRAIAECYLLMRDAAIKDEK